jgi:WhiB family transcriptional regulator, redox-sensing transcriptional regulator
VLTSCPTEPSSVAGASVVLGPALDPISRRDPADLPCQKDPDLWFAESPVDLELAKAFCTDCPARVACLAGAVSRRECWGVWGGEIFDRGRIVARKRPRGRPRKPDVAA